MKKPRRDRSITVPIRIDKATFDFYNQVAKSAGVTMSQAVTVVLALALHQGTLKGPGV